MNRTPLRIAGRSLVYCALLLPVAPLAMVATLLGRASRAVAWWRALRLHVLGAPPSPASGSHRAAEVSATTGQGSGPSAFAVAGHALASAALGAVALVPLGIELVWLLRGVLYGVVDPGPYDHSWGGPTRAGAWLAHFLISTAFALAGLAVLAGIAALHQRLTVALDGAPRPRWAVPVVALSSLAAALLVVAWTRQL